MEQVQAEITIDCPTEDVFSYISNPRNESTWMPGAAQISNVSSESTDVGTTYDSRVHFLGKGMDFKVEVTEFQKPSTYGYRATHGSIDSYRHFQLKSVPEGGTQVVMELKANSPRSVIRLAEDVLMRAGHRHEQHSLENLRDILESKGSSAAAG